MEIKILTDNRFVVDWLTGKSCVANPLDIMVHAVRAEAAVANINITSLAKIFCVLVNHSTIVVFRDDFRHWDTKICRVHSASVDFNSSRRDLSSLTRSMAGIWQGLCHLKDDFIHLSFLYFPHLHFLPPDICLEPEKWQQFSPEKVIGVKTEIKYLLTKTGQISFLILPKMPRQNKTYIYMVNIFSFPELRRAYPCVVKWSSWQGTRWHATQLPDHLTARPQVPHSNSTFCSSACSYTTAGSSAPSPQLSSPPSVTR